jgi:hypothetical protein
MKVPSWTQISITIGGRKIVGEYCLDGHMVKVKTADREKATEAGNFKPETLAREMLRELAEDGKV